MLAHLAPSPASPDTPSEGEKEGAALVIRRAYASDIPVVVRLDGTDDHMARPAINAERRLLGKVIAGDIFLGFMGPMPVAYARYDSLWPEMVPLLAWMWVHPEHRREGIAQAMRQYTFAVLREDGVSSVLRSACTARPEMITRLRQECGSEAGRLQYENGIEEVFFWKRLS